MITSNPVRHHILYADSFKKYADIAEKQQKGYFKLLQINGYIDADKEYSDQGLKNGLYKLLNKTTEGFNSKDLSDAHIQEMGNILTQRILDENYVEIDANGIAALVQQAINEKSIPKKTGLVREIMVIERLARLKNELIESKYGTYKITDTSPRGSFEDSVRYDIGVEFVSGIGQNTDTGYVDKQLHLEIKSKLDSFHITGFKGSTLLSNEAYDKLKQVVMKQLKIYFRGNQDTDYFSVKDTQDFRRVLAEYVVKWKIGKIFPIFYKIGERGGSSNILLCTEFIKNITSTVGVSDVLQFKQLSTLHRTEYDTMTLLERGELTPQEIEAAQKKAADIVVMGVSQYDLWYGKK